MAVAWQESTWRQFTCDRQVLMNGNATGLMQIMATYWPEGYNTELQRQIVLGDRCSGTGYRGNETYNKDLGEDIWNHRRQVAINRIGQYNPDNEQLVKETAAIYHGGYSGRYWDPDMLPDEWVALDNPHVGYANTIWNHHVNQPWSNHLNCPCGS